jgi:type IV pilus assembly protein PilB
MTPKMQARSKQLSGFAKYLVEQNLLEHTIVKELITPILNDNETLITKLITNNSLDGTDLARAIADYFNIPFVDLKQLKHNQLSLDLLQPQLIQKYRVLPLAKTNDQLQLALADC